ncbi:MAG: fatty acid desaturase [Gammaproteobacteria bacterium]
MQFLLKYQYGLLDLSLWGYVLTTLLFIHVTMIGITLYYHRDQAHRSVALHPALRHFFRFWLWINTGASTKEWVAVHRKHHAMCEREGDPHSPRLFGLKKVLLEGAELYQAEANKPETREKYGRGTPDDWLERKVYRLRYSGIFVLVLINLVLFGAPGIIMIACQLITMPLLAAGVINGLCHARGYRNFETDDVSTNLWPIGILVAGEELHNNHHAFPSSAKFSVRPWEVDMGWLHLKVFSALGLAKIKRVVPVPELDQESSVPDLGTVRAIIVNRMHVLRHYTQSVTIPVLRRDLNSLGWGTDSTIVKQAKKLLMWQPGMLDESSKQRLVEILEDHPSVRTVLEFRDELKGLWEGAHSSNENLLADLRSWCRKAESSSIKGLQEFAAYLQSFRAVLGPEIT